MRLPEIPSSRRTVRPRFLLALSLTLVLTGCGTVTVPESFAYRKIHAEPFALASWQKITAPGDDYHIYIEGDGYAFNAHGRPSSDPTPRADTMRALAFGDPHPNVVYLARPCQFIQSKACHPRYWSSARFSEEVVSAVHQAVRQIAGNNPIELIGYSGGAQVAGLVAVLYDDLSVRQLITIAGNLDHAAWCRHHNLPLLTGSLSLADYKDKYLSFRQTHFVGGKDRVVPPGLVRDFAQSASYGSVVEIEEASHGSGWEAIAPLLYGEAKTK